VGAAFTALPDRRLLECLDADETGGGPVRHNYSTRANDLSALKLAEFCVGKHKSKMNSEGRIQGHTRLNRRLQADRPHLPRGVWLRHFEEEGASEAEIGGAAGQRSPAALQQSYLAVPAYDCIRVAAGIPADASHNYAARALLEPPKELAVSSPTLSNKTSPNKEHSRAEHSQKKEAERPAPLPAPPSRHIPWHLLGFAYTKFNSFPNVSLFAPGTCRLH